MDISCLLSDASFFSFAMKVDVELAEKTRLKKCPHCGGKLHFARYQRKGRLGKVETPEGWDSFHSLCCAREGCRRRVRPISVRFAGQSPFNSTLVLLVKLAKSGGSERSTRSLCEALSVSERTIRRWLRFWKETHKKSTWWRKLASKFSLSGQSLNELWEILIKTKKTIKESFEYLLLSSGELWQETRFFVGYHRSAKDA